MTKQPSTYLDHAIAAAELEAQGRFKKQAESKITGTPTYPRQPSNSPWASPDPTGPEPPFPFDIDFVGELGGESPARVVSASTVEAANATERGASPTALTGAPQLIRRRRV